jgi:hypothetical protein
MLRPKKCKQCGGKMQTGGRPRTIEAANAYAKDFALRRNLVSGENTYVGNQLPVYRDVYGNILPDNPTPVSPVLASSYVPAGIDSLEWSTDTNLPYYSDPQTGDMKFVQESLFYSPRFNKNRGLSKEEIRAQSSSRSTAMRMYGGKLRKIQQGGFPGVIPPDMNHQFPPEIPVTPQTERDRIQQMIDAGLLPAPTGFDNAQQWYNDFNQSPSVTSPTPMMKGNTAQNIGIGMMRASNLLGEISGRVERNRQNRYDYQQQSALGMMNPIPAGSFQPTPYSLYAKYGGSLRRYKSGGNQKAPTSDSATIRKRVRNARY